MEDELSESAKILSQAVQNMSSLWGEAVQQGRGSFSEVHTHLVGGEDKPLGVHTRLRGGLMWPSRGVGRTMDKKISDEAQKELLDALMRDAPNLWSPPANVLRWYRSLEEQRGGLLWHISLTLQIWPGDMEQPQPRGCVL